jgi:hypothetical protein
MVPMAAAHGVGPAGDRSHATARRAQFMPPVSLGMRGYSTAGLQPASSPGAAAGSATQHSMKIVNSLFETAPAAAGAAMRRGTGRNAPPAPDDSISESRLERLERLMDSMLGSLPTVQAPSSRASHGGGAAAFQTWGGSTLPQQAQRAPRAHDGASASYDTWAGTMLPRSTPPQHAQRSAQRGRSAAREAQRREAQRRQLQAAAPALLANSLADPRDGRQTQRSVAGSSAERNGAAGWATHSGACDLAASPVRCRPQRAATTTPSS